MDRFFPRSTLGKEIASPAVFDETANAAALEEAGCIETSEAALTCFKKSRRPGQHFPVFFMMGLPVIMKQDLCATWFACRPKSKRDRFAQDDSGERSLIGIKPPYTFFAGRHQAGVR